MIEWQVLPTERFAGHHCLWDELVRQHGWPPFLQSRFVGAAAAAFLGGTHRFALATTEGRPVAAAILVRQDSFRWSTFQPSQLPMGAWVAARDCSTESLASSLVRRLPGPALLLALTQQDPAVSPRPAESAAVDTVDYISTAWIDRRGSFEEFWEARGKNLKQNLRKQRRKLESESRRLGFEAAVTPERVAAVLREFAAIESRGWKAQEGTAIAPDNAQGRFYADALARFAATGDALACALRIDDTPVAADLCVQDGSSIVILKTTYDEAYKSLSPGQLLHEETFRHLYERPDLARIEFYGRVMEWHTRWTEQARNQFHINVYRWPWVKRLSRLRRSEAAVTASVSEAPARSVPP
ncbi:MAG: GNAT family N-acetyltransferase [Steroidobacteraceae bacterium]